jgi:hypothetical protein
MQLKLKQSSKQILDKLELFETINVSLLDRLISSNSLDKKEKLPLFAIKKKIKNGKLSVKYSKKKVNVGRVYPIPYISIGVLKRKIRHTLCKNDWVDIDMVCAQPVLLEQICKKHNFNCPNLTNYIENRNDCLHFFMEEYKVDRDTVKELFNRLMFLGSFEGWLKDNNLKRIETCNADALEEELKTIANNIVNCNDDLKNIIRRSKDDEAKTNIDGSTVSYFLQDYERQVLEVVYEYLLENNYIKNNEAILCHDGIMIRKENYKDSILEEISNQVLLKTGFNVKYIVKEMNEGISLDKLDIDDDSKYIIYKEEFEKTFFKLNNPICYCAELDNGQLQFLSDSDLKLYLKDTTYKFNDVMTNFYDKWSIDPMKRKFEKIVFNPSKTQDPTHYNTFKGFKYDDETFLYDLDEKDCKFLELLKHLCIDKTIYNYFLDWISKIVQCPDRKTEWAIVLYSNIHGIGKNAIVDFLFKLFENYTAKIDEIEDLLKKFNTNLCSKFIIAGDEISARAKTVSNQMKNIITRKYSNMERKGFDSIMIDDYSNYIFTTNNESCFTIEKDDRRYFMIRCTEELKPDSFFSDFYKELNDIHMLKKIFKFFKNRDIEYVINKAPTTDYKLELTIEQKPAYLQMLYNRTAFFAEKTLSSSKLFELSKEYAKKRFLTSTYTQTRFGIDMKLFLELYKKKNSVITYSFPSLPELREHLFNYDNSYYKYINGLSEDDDVTNFEDVSDLGFNDFNFI